MADQFQIVISGSVCWFFPLLYHNLTTTYTNKTYCSPLMQTLMGILQFTEIDFYMQNWRNWQKYNSWLIIANLITYMHVPGFLKLICLNISACVCVFVLGQSLSSYISSNKTRSTAFQFLYVVYYKCTMNACQRY